MLPRDLCVSLVWKIAPLSSKNDWFFCPFNTLDHHKNPYKPIMFAKEISTDTQGKKKLNFENFVHYFSEGVRITVDGT